MTDKDRKLAEEILNDIMFEHYKIKFVSIENASSSLLTLRSFGIWKAMLKAMEEYAGQRIREESIKYEEKIKKLEFMIENGLGWKDMINDITMPHEI